jgi:hypothetical protein
MTLDTQHLFGWLVFPFMANHYSIQDTKAGFIKSEQADMANLKYSETHTKLLKSS